MTRNLKPGPINRLHQQLVALETLFCLQLLQFSTKLNFIYVLHLFWDLRDWRHMQPAVQYEESRSTIENTFHL